MLPTIAAKFSKRTYRLLSQPPVGLKPTHRVSRCNRLRLAEGSRIQRGHSKFVSDRIYLYTAAGKSKISM